MPARRPLGALLPERLGAVSHEADVRVAPLRDGPGRKDLVLGVLRNLLLDAPASNDLVTKGAVLGLGPKTDAAEKLLALLLGGGRNLAAGT
jgi:hypothetical protein